MTFNDYFEDYKESLDILMEVAIEKNYDIQESITEYVEHLIERSVNFSLSDIMDFISDYENYGTESGNEFVEYDFPDNEWKPGEINIYTLFECNFLTQMKKQLNEYAQEKWGDN